jgi:hypothetical protein
MPKRKVYHFSCGDSGKGPVGFAARVIATSKQAALATLSEALWEHFEAIRDEDDIEYLTFYCNPDYVSVKDIDEYEELD